MTQLARPPPPIAYDTNSSSRSFASALGDPEGLEVLITQIEPFRPLDQLDLLVSLLDMLVTVAQPPEDDCVQSYSENTVSCVKTSLSPVIDARPPNAMTYKQLISAARVTFSSITDESERWALAALSIQLYLHSVYVGETTMVPSNSSGTATARKKRSIA